MTHEAAVAARAGSTIRTRARARIAGLDDAAAVAVRSRTPIVARGPGACVRRNHAGVAGLRLDLERDDEIAGEEAVRLGLPVEGVDGPALFAEDEVAAGRERRTGRDVG